MSKYQQCLDEPKNLKLCKRGYCTAKMKFDVYPSAYANIYASRVCQGEIEDYEGNKIVENEKGLESGLQRWLDEKWVNVCESKPYPPCGRKSTKEGQYPYCRPLVRVNEKTPRTVDELTEEEISAMCVLKHTVPQGVEGKPTRFVLDSPLHKKTVRELKDMCKEKGLPCYSKLRKAELIEVLNNLS